MAKDLEALRERGLIDSYSADEAFGIAVNQLMFRKGITRKKLGEILGISGVNAGMKLRGETRWSLLDIFRVAKFFGVSVNELMPEEGKVKSAEDLSEENEAGFFPSAAVVGRAGLEPATQGL